MNPVYTVVIAKLELVRGQLDRGSVKSCTRSPGHFGVHHALVHVHRVRKVTSLGDSDKGAIYRLAGARKISA
ncbi:hypothetical protein [Streptomyces sp. NPDC056387]|uniref:hypothetical protein n=1 Tax=Streptomyces sp. NPDC056387 TaxID=3345803 RepID=UPI0035D8F1ED